MNFPATKSISLARAHETSRVDELETTLARAARFARKHTVAAIYRSGSGHPGSALACVDILACLFGAELNVWPSTVGDPDCDRLVLSDGRVEPALYAVAAHYEFCDSRRALAAAVARGSKTSELRTRDLPFVEINSGASGQGLSIALGMALGLELQQRPSRVYALLEDTELEAGEVWYAAMSAAHHETDNLCVIISDGRRQASGSCDRLPQLGPLAAKWRAFDWAVSEIDGHDTGQILSAFRRTGSVHGRPALIIAHTTAGKGVPAFEGAPRSRHASTLTRQQAEDALTALGANSREITELLDDDC